MLSSTFKAARTHNRKFPGKVGKRPDNSTLRKQEAAARQEAAYGRTPQQQLARLDQLGIRASREREKLQERIQARKKPVETFIAGAKKEKK